MTTENKPILNKVKQRCLILSPTVKECLEKEGSKSDFYRDGDKPIGRGGFGEVWKVIHKATNKLYCIKVISKRSIIDQKMVEQMNREIEIMYKLNHPHVVKLVNHFEDDESFYLIMHYASKGQLYSHLKKAGRFDQKTAAQYMRDTICALQYIHSFDPPIIHRDIKPENILLDENNRVKLADFGWSNYMNTDDDFRKTYCGTPEYLAPEMLSKKGHDKTVDIWSVGVLLFELLCGSSPFAATNQEELFNNIRRHKIGWTSDFPPLAKNLISKILRPNPKDRISLEEILSHIWFEQNQPIYKILELPSKDPKKILESHLLSIKPEAIQEELNKIVEKVANLRMTRTTMAIDISNQQPNNQEKQGFGDGNLNNFKLNNNSQKVNPNTIILEQQINNLTKENQDLKKKLENIQTEYSKLDQNRLKDLNTIKALESEKAEFKKEIDKYILLNKDRINALAELEEKTNKLIESEFKVKTIQNELDNNKEQLSLSIFKSNEIADQLVKNEEKSNSFKKKYFELSQSKEEMISDYQKKLEVMQNKLLIGNQNNNDNSCNDMLEIINENILEFKKLFNNKMTNITIILNDLKEEFVVSEKNIKINLDLRYLEVSDTIGKLTKRIEDEVNKFNNVDYQLLNNESKKNQKEQWLSEQVIELQPFKSKYLNLEVKLKKTESEILLYKSKCDTLEDLYQETKKTTVQKEKELRKRINEISNLESKLSDLKDFIYKECNNKLDEFNNCFKS